MKKLIVNADDFGYSYGINKGIIKAHKDGVVTSTSLMVFRAASKDAKNLFKYPNISVGLHFDITEENLKADFMKIMPLLPSLIKKIKKDFQGQVDEFEKIMGKRPDHLAAHHHIHCNPQIKPIFKEYSEKHNIPVRDFKDFNFIDSFFGWDRLKKKKLERISVRAFLGILSNLKEGVSEIMCHPGYVDHSLKSKYLQERERELETLTDLRVKDFIKNSNIDLCSWKEIQSNNF